MVTIRPSGLTKAHLEAANIGQDYWECSFKNYEGPKEARNAGMKYLTQLAGLKEKGVGLLLVGPNGPGKTTLAMIIMKYLIRANWSVYCTSLGEIVEQIQRSWRDKSDSEEQSYLAKCKKSDFLLIDDVGKEHRGQTGFTQNIFDNLIRFRTQHRLPTFLTSNLTKSEIEATYGESILSLLEGKLIPVTVSGQDHRRTELKKLNKELMK